MRFPKNYTKLSLATFLASYDCPLMIQFHNLGLQDLCINHQKTMCSVTKGEYTIALCNI